eukprot:1152427-Pelagomonas_calceolata.AAC.1
MTQTVYGILDEGLLQPQKQPRCAIVIMQMTRCADSTQLPTSEYNGTDLEVVTEFKYFGVLLRRDAKMNAATSQMAYNFLVGGIARVKEAGAELGILNRKHAMIWLFQVVALTAGIYGCQIWAITKLSFESSAKTKARVYHTGFLKCIMRFGTFFPALTDLRTQFQRLFSSAPPGIAPRLRDFMNKADVLGFAKHVLLQLSCPRRECPHCLRGVSFFLLLTAKVFLVAVGLNILILGYAHMYALLELHICLSILWKKKKKKKKLCRQRSSPYIN